jgi:hypothetical protein
MNAKKLFALSLVVSVLSVLGCNDAPEDQATAELRLPGICGFHVGRYIFALGERLDSGAGCQYAPTTEDLILPTEHAGVACSTFLSHYAAEPASGYSRFLGQDQTCNWSRNGDVGTCVINQKARVAGVECASKFAMTYKRVEVIAW